MLSGRVPPGVYRSSTERTSGVPKFFSEVFFPLSLFFFSAQPGGFSKENKGKLKKINEN